MTNIVGFLLVAGILFWCIMDILKRQKLLLIFSKKTMNDQKDNLKNKQKIGNNTLGQDTVFNKKELENKDVYSFVLKKTEKIVTALYLVTDCMDTEDAIKMRMRMRGVELLSHLHQIPVLSPVEKHTHITTSKTQIEELVSLVEVSNMIGFISSMNAGILKNELSVLIQELSNHQSAWNGGYTPGDLFENRRISDLVLSDEIFHVDENSYPKISPSGAMKTGNQGILDKGQINKKTNDLSFNKVADRLSLYGKIGSTNAPVLNENIVPKKDRSETIKNIIKDKIEVSIKDISVAFSDCSEKTIQRELNDLISKGQIKKIGEKRWSRYSLV